MASIKKFTDKAAASVIGHVDRTLEYSHMSNQAIDFARTKENYSLVPERNLSGYEYYQRLIRGCYVYGRDNVKTLAGVIITLPHDTPIEDADKFFRTSYQFLNERFCGERAVVSCSVHMDEERPHMHYLFVPVVENLDKKGSSRYVPAPEVGPDERREAERYKLKVSASDVLTRKSYLTFHDDFQRYLQEKGCPGTVKSGVTKAQGRSLSVKELKRETPRERAEREAKIERNLQRSRWEQQTQEHERDRGRW